MARMDVGRTYSFGMGQFKAPNAMPALVEMPVTERREALIEMAQLEEMHRINSEQWMRLQSNGRGHPQRGGPRRRHARADSPSPPGAADGVDALAGVRQRLADDHLPPYELAARRSTTAGSPATSRRSRARRCGPTRPTATRCRTSRRGSSSSRTTRAISV
jgi:hypothetical protein